MLGLEGLVWFGRLGFGMTGLVWFGSVWKRWLSLAGWVWYGILGLEWQVRFGTSC